MRHADNEPKVTFGNISNTLAEAKHSKDKELRWVRVMVGGLERVELGL